MTDSLFALARPGKRRFVVRAFVLALFMTAPIRDSAFPEKGAGSIPYIVALRVELNVDDVVREYQLQPTHTYWRKINGFAAVLDAAMAARLKKDKRVTAVQPEKDAMAIVILGSQTDPIAIGTEFGVRPKHFYTKALKGFVAQMEGEKIAQLEADQSAERDKRARILSVGLDGGAMHIVTLRRDADPDAVARQMGLKPYQVYRYAMRGFASAMTSDALANLDTDIRVLAVESEGEMSICGQTVPNGVVRLSWNSAVDRAYQMQYKMNLKQAYWINVGNPIWATNATAAFSDIVAGDQQRFYRVILIH